MPPTKAISTACLLTGLLSAHALHAQTATNVDWPVPAVFEPEHHCGAIVPPATPQDQPSLRLGLVCGDRTNIDVLWAYTPDALASVGGDVTTLQSLCETDIQSVNTAFANTQLPFTARMVGLISTDYDESGDHLALLQGTSDGVMDEVHAARDAAAADIVALITVTGYCGLAYVAPDNAALGFQKITTGCFGNGAFRHELGHNLGSKHWAHDSGGYFPYSAGHVLTLSGGNTVGTAMGGNSLPQFSNPRVQYQGVQTGLPIGIDDASADNWLAFMQTVPMVADFRCSGDCNANGVLDVIEILSGSAADCDGNGTPDECQVDLDGNGTIDACDPVPVIVRVPEDLPSVQLAITLSESGVHEIVVGPGSWYGGIDTFGKAIGITSTHGPEATTIDAYGSGRAVTFRSSEGLGTVLDGFTLTGGSAVGDGGGMLIDQASPTIRNCIFTHNNATSAGGGLRVTNGSPLISDCVFEANTATWGGGGSVWSGTPRFERCVFSGNTAKNAGGGISSWMSDSGFINCEFKSNASATSGGGLFIVDGGGVFAPDIESTRFCGNTPNHINVAQWNDNGGNEFLNDCASSCLPDVNGDGMVTPTDFTAWINAFNNNLPECDQNGDGSCTPTDFTAWIANFNAGC